VEAKEASNAHIPEVVQERPHEEGSLPAGLKFTNIVAGTPHLVSAFDPSRTLAHRLRLLWVANPNIYRAADGLEAFHR
jgi:hypothetical protein